MDNKTLTIYILTAILLIVGTVYVTLQFQPKPVMLQRDSVYQKVIDSLNVIRKDIQRLEEIQDSALMINQSGIIANRNYYIKVMNDFMRLQDKKKSLPLQEQWNEYVKELNNE